ncbi:MAG: M20/M25/M40 family metallo-hydrolase, partial [Candidatus Aminicenantales bacterium]
MTEKAEMKEGLPRIFLSFAGLLVIVLAAFLAIRAMAPPKIVLAGASAAEFSADRASRFLEEISSKPHPLGTPAHDEVRDRILRMWREMGFEPEIQKGLYLEASDGYGARIENILVRLPGAKPLPGGTLMLATHYDSVAAAPGAADDGSGVAALLETARALKAGPPLAGDVIFLITDAEEDGLMGAHVFQAEHPWATDVGLVLNFEARGTAGPSLMFETSAGNGNLISALSAAPHPRAYSFGATIYKSMPNDTDLSVWMEAGIQGMNFAFIGRPYDYHTGGDSFARLDLRSLQHHGSYALALARYFGNGGVPPRTQGNAVHFSLFGDLLVRYSGTAAVLLIAVIAVLLGVAGSLGMKRKMLRLSGILRGVLFMIGAMILSGGLGFGFLTLVKSAHGSWLPAGPWPYSLGYFLATIFLAAGATTFLHGLLRARKSGFGMAFGAAVLWFCLTVPVTLLALDSRYLTAGPALFLAVGVLTWAGRGKSAEEKKHAPSFIGAALAAVGVVLIAAPLALLFFESMFLSPLIAAFLAVLVSIMLAAMTPAIEILRKGLGRGLPVLCFGLFMVLAVMAAFTVRYTEEIPRLASFQYLQDFDTGRAYWVAMTNAPDSWTEQIGGGKFQAGHPQPEFISRPEMVSFREAPVSNETPPDVRVVEDHESGSSRQLRIRIVSPRGGRLISIFLKAEKLVAVTLEGRPLVLDPRKADVFNLTFLNPGP